MLAVHRLAAVAAGVALTAVMSIGTAGAATPPSFTTSAAPPPLGQDAGEPSIGVNWKTGATFIQAGNHTLRVLFDGSGHATWADKRSPFARVSLDPILWADSAN